MTTFVFHERGIIMEGRYNGYIFKNHICVIMHYVIIKYLKKKTGHRFLKNIRPIVQQLKLFVSIKEKKKYIQGGHN